MSTSGIDVRFRIVRNTFQLHVDLQLPGRGVTALFGASGSGKTSCLRMLAGLEHAMEQDGDAYLSVNGEVWQDDSRNLFVPTHQREIGYVFQEANLFPHLSVQSNLEYGLRRVAPANRKVSLQQAVTMLGIDHLLERMPEKLSGGEKQRVSIARALATSPRILLMDEPLAALDLQRKQEILPYLERLHDELEIPVIYVSHAPDEVARLADHLVVLEKGKVQASGPLQEILARIDLPIRLGEDAGVVLKGQITEVDADWYLARVAFDGGSLWIRDSGLPVGQKVRVRILARDISIALEPQGRNSILNVLPATVEEIVDDFHPALSLLRIAAGQSVLVARITRRSKENLRLQPGSQVWAQIKAVALVG